MVGGDGSGSDSGSSVVSNGTGEHGKHNRQWFASSSSSNSVNARTQNKDQ